MLFRILKYPAKLALFIYCRHLRIRNKAMLQQRGPLLLAANHPNSFLDAIILATLFKQPIYSLARGDAFANNFISKLLKQLNILPVYRLSEGAENLASNYNTFDTCREIFAKNGIVLIFIEGCCINEWHLRSLMKGTARLALSSWQADIPLQVLPVGINYHSFSSFGKNIHLHFGELVGQTAIDNNLSEGKRIATFNTLMQQQLQTMVYEIDTADKTTLQTTFANPVHPLLRALLFIPGIIGWLVHQPLYRPLRNTLWKKLAHLDHFDSGITGSLFLLYPVYLFLLTFITWLLTGKAIAWALLLVLPFCAWAWVRVKRQFP